MSQDLVVKPQLPALVPDVHEMQVYQTIAAQAQGSKFYQNMNGEAGILSIMLYARELGIPPMLAISGGFHNIQGHVEMSARMINRQIRMSGHGIQIEELTDTRCAIKGKRKDTGEEYTAIYTIEDAQKAGLVKDGGNWKKSPQDMLFARAVSRLGRRLFPDVIGTAYVEGEVKDTIQWHQPEKGTITIESLQPVQETVDDAQPEEQSMFPEAKTCKQVRDEWLAFCTENKVTQPGLRYVSKLLGDHFGNSKIAEFPDDMAEQVGSFLRDIVIPELQKENYLPMDRG